MKESLLKNDNWSKYVVIAKFLGGLVHVCGREN